MFMLCLNVMFIVLNANSHIKPLNETRSISTKFHFNKKDICYWENQRLKTPIKALS